MSTATFTATIRLGLVVSVVAALIAVSLTFVGEVSQWSLTAVVAATAFALSWMQSCRLERGGQPLVVWSSVARQVGRRPG
jgi:hypothetical protein